VLIVDDNTTSGNEIRQIHTIHPFWPEPVWGKTLLFSVFFLFFAVTLHKLTYSGIWLDEGFDYLAARMPLAEMLPALMVDAQQPPLYTVLLHFLLKISSTEFWFRFTSVLIALFGCVGLYSAVNKAKGWVAALLAVFIYTFMPTAVYYNQECAEYVLVIALLFWVMSFFVSLLYRFDRKDAVAFVIFSALAIYSQYGAAFPLCAVGIALLVFYIAAKKWNALKELSVLMTGTAVLLGLPLYYFFLRIQMSVPLYRKSSIEPYEGLLNEGWAFAQNLEGALSFLFRFYYSHTLFYPIAIYFLYGAIVALISLRVSKNIRSSPLPKILFLSLAVAAVAVFSVAYWRTDYYHFAFVLHAALIALLIVRVSLNGRGTSKIIGLSAAALFTFLFSIAAGDNFYYPTIVFILHSAMVTLVLIGALRDRREPAKYLSLAAILAFCSFYIAIRLRLHPMTYARYWLPLLPVFFVTLALLTGEYFSHLRDYLSRRGYRTSRVLPLAIAVVLVFLFAYNNWQRIKFNWEKQSVRETLQYLIDNDGFDRPLYIYYFAIPQFVFYANQAGLDYGADAVAAWGINGSAGKGSPEITRYKNFYYGETLRSQGEAAVTASIEKSFSGKMPDSFRVLFCHSAIDKDIYERVFKNLGYGVSERLIVGGSELLLLHR
jgi:hypothetical protein